MEFWLEHLQEKVIFNYINSDCCNIGWSSGSSDNHPCIVLHQTLQETLDKEVSFGDWDYGTCMNIN